MRDPELPNGFQDADFEMRDLGAAARRITRARKRGLCAHGWRQGYPGYPVIGSAKCLDCGKEATVEALDTERQAILQGA